MGKKEKQARQWVGEMVEKFDFMLRPTARSVSEEHIPAVYEMTQKAMSGDEIAFLWLKALYHDDPAERLAAIAGLRLKRLQ
jgi:hypothetical protein